MRSKELLRQGTKSSEDKTGSFKNDLNDHVPANRNRMALNKNSGYSFEKISISNPNIASNPAMLQAKLAVSQPGDQYEREADAMADKVMGITMTQNNFSSAPNNIQRKCAQCEEEDEQKIQRKESNSELVSFAPPVVYNVLSSSPGKPMDNNTRSFMESRFNYDFSNVRIHDNNQAAKSAGSINALAYTSNNNIVFNSGRYNTQSFTGKRLLAHELTHVVQQNNNTTPAQMVQRDQDEGSSTGSRTDRIIEEVAVTASQSLRMLPGMQMIPETVFAALTAAEAAFIIRMGQRLIQQGEYMAVLSRVRELASPSVAAEFAVRYMWGVLKGLVSPITGLIGLATAAFEFQNAAIHWVVDRAPHIPELATEMRALGDDFNHFTVTARQTFHSLRQQGRVLHFAGAILSSVTSAGNDFERRIVTMAREKGAHAANSLINSLLNTPLPELAEIVGEIIGTVVIELVMLLFTDGIGNLISKIGESVSAFRAVSRLGRGLGFTGEMLVTIGRAIHKVEEIVGVLMSRTVLRPFMPVFEALEPLLGRMRLLAQRMAGISAEAGTGVARLGVNAAERTGGTGAREADRLSGHATPPHSTGRPNLRSIQGGGQTTPARTRHLRDASLPPARRTPAIPAAAEHPNQLPARATAPSEPIRPASGPRRQSIQGGGQTTPRRSGHLRDVSAGQPHPHAEPHMEDIPIAAHIETEQLELHELPLASGDLPRGPVASAGGPRRPGSITGGQAPSQPTRTTTTPTSPQNVRPRRSGGGNTEVPNRRTPTSTSSEPVQQRRPLNLDDETRSDLSGRRANEIDEPVPLSQEDIDHLKLRTQQSSTRSIEQARQAGLPSEVYGDGYVMTSADFSDIVPTTIPRGRNAPDALPIPGRRVSRSTIQNTELQADIQLMEAHLQRTELSIVEMRVDQTQVNLAGERVGTNRPDFQLTVLSGESSGRRVYIEYDRSPPTRALDHARRIISNDPDAIVILKIIDFE